MMWFYWDRFEFSKLNVSWDVRRLWGCVYCWCCSLEEILVWYVIAHKLTIIKRQKITITIDSVVLKASIGLYIEK